ncbi:hypothetical protein Bca52824_057508 [Brassica carinata]|uniref:Uncharacterized protein n=1 Tax=Brassica carinata TaxID=52824 RepID=A0A8X7QW81_BRACI|nr:hypothetical protein Bca52824_057508 [Brassica carinata]
MAVLAWLNGGDWSTVSREWFGQDDGFEAPPAINTSHVKAESNKNGTGFVELMGRYSGGLLEFIETHNKLNGHMVIVLDEEAEQELMCKSMESNRLL